MNDIYGIRLPYFMTDNASGFANVMVRMGDQVKVVKFVIDSIHDFK
jgi:hypothetical protein